ncbi:hypothetical protein [Lyngbya aestuarii]|uniref:hypothetical protein n=1 Tax=Lyngbya aestuarii TaxID=118322 RepID=UPI00403E0851
MAIAKRCCICADRLNRYEFERLYNAMPNDSTKRFSTVGCTALLSLHRDGGMI